MDLQQAIQILRAGQYTCVLCRDEHIITSTRRGVAPLMGFWEENRNLSGYSAADKVVGKGTALLYCLLDVKAVYAHVMSKPALQVLQTHGIDAAYDRLVDAIANRSGDGLCPIETATRSIHNPADAPEAIRTALKNLQ